MRRFILIEREVLVMRHRTPPQPPKPSGDFVDVILTFVGVAFSVVATCFMLLVIAGWISSIFAP